MSDSNSNNIKRYIFPEMKENFIPKPVPLKNKARVFKCLGQVSSGERCEVQCPICKKAYEPKTEKE
jgi:hypothetical protein